MHNRDACAWTHRWNAGKWPIPEAYAATPALTKLPPRRARPALVVSHVNASSIHNHEYDPRCGCIPPIPLAHTCGIRVFAAFSHVLYATSVLGFPVDVYDLMRSHVTDALYQASSSNPLLCWPVRVLTGDRSSERPWQSCVAPVVRMLWALPFIAVCALSMWIHRHEPRAHSQPGSSQGELWRRTADVCAVPPSVRRRVRLLARTHLW